MQNYNEWPIAILATNFLFCDYLFYTDVLFNDSDIDYRILSPLKKRLIHF